MSATGISVVTTTWNERENIKNLILSIRIALKDFPHEIIVVDDDSSDGTIQLAKRARNCAGTSSTSTTHFLATSGTTQLKL